MVFDINNMKPLFEFVERCESVKQSPLHHPEGNVFTHTLQVTELAFRETWDVELILAAFLHDIGKYENSKGHEQIAIEWLEPYASVKTLWLIEHHMRVWYYFYGSMRKQSKCVYLLNHPWLPELIQLARWDYAGRVPNKRIKYNRFDFMERLNKASEQHFCKQAMFQGKA